MAESFSQLLREVHACRLCEKSLPLGARPVVQVHPDAKILIAGQAPGKRVHETGIPFNDPSGDRLRDWLGLTQSTFYDQRTVALLPMGFCYPGTGASGDLPPRPECEPAWRAKLLSHLRSVKITLLLGQYAQKSYLGARRCKTLTETVRNWQAYGPNVMPLPHPSPRNNLWLKKNPWFEDNLLPLVRAKIRQLMDSICGSI